MLMLEDNSIIKLIVGLGNPGNEYQNTRHNVGFWLVNQVADIHNIQPKLEKNFNATTAKIFINNNPIHLLCPNTYMNNSGNSLISIVNYYKIPISSILVVHDDLDLPLGAIKFKLGGGNGGHNGLKSIISRLNNNKNFLRLRIGIGRPITQETISSYVLSAPSKNDTITIHRAIDNAINVLAKAIDPNTRAQAIKDLHSNQL
jgi:PTH1 family peptidyl-tRNA hydrolase